ncbi:MAG: hypothetical protein WC505_07185 [Patescibacteria group bacterium]
MSTAKFIGDILGRIFKNGKYASKADLDRANERIDKYIIPTAQAIGSLGTLAAEIVKRLDKGDEIFPTHDRVKLMIAEHHEHCRQRRKEDKDSVI